MTGQTLTQVLEDGRKDVVDTLRAVPAEHAAAKPAPDRWSPLECIEHVVTVEHRFLGWITNGTPIEPEPRRDREKRIFDLILDRSHKAQAPEAVLPAGNFQSMEDAIIAFNAARDLSVQVAKTRATELYAVGVKHPRFGGMNAAELVHLIAGHARRHAAQIRETVATLRG